MSRRPMPPAVREERGGLLRRWHHTLAVEPVTATTSRYADTIDIDAGPLTGLMYWSATVLFRYRQRRWQHLARTLAATEAPTGARGA